MDFYNHAAITPRRTTITRAHTVHNQLFIARSGRNDKTTGAHTKAINATTIHLSHERIFGSGQIFTSTLPIVILYLVDKLRGMFQPDAYGYAFSLDGNMRIGHVTINIAGTMTGRKNNRSSVNFLGTGH